MAEILINQKNYDHNINQIAKFAGGVEKIILVLKDNAYGHGLRLICQRASELGIKFACVKNEEEAKICKEFFKEVLILSHIPNGNEDKDLTYAINDINQIPLLKSGSKVQISVDTLMRRHGIKLEDLAKTTKNIAQKGLILTGAYTHFRSSDEINSEYFVQKYNFNLAKEILKQSTKEFGFRLKFHSQNSAALERAQRNLEDFVRVGIAQHGYSQFGDNPLNLKPTLSLYANRISHRVLHQGESIGYGGVFVANCDIDVATYDLGYGDGLLRYNGIGDLRLANGEKMLGKMSMDGFSSKNCGDKICLFDDARVWAKFFNTISYDVLVKLNPQIPRRWV